MYLYNLGNNIAVGTDYSLCEIVMLSLCQHLCHCLYCIHSCIVSLKGLVSSQPPFAASLSPPLSAPRHLGDSAASVRDAFGILAMADLMQGDSAASVRDAFGILAMADLMQASFCSFGLAKRLE